MLYVTDNDQEDGDFVLAFNKAEWQLRCCSRELGEPLEEAVSMLILSGRDYTPAWVLALEDTELYLEFRPEILDQPKPALEQFCHSLRFHLERQADDGSFLLEHPKGSGHYHWIVGYAEIPDGGILYIEGGITYPSPASEFGLSSEKMKHRFPDTPRHYYDKRGLGDDYVPPSLS